MSALDKLNARANINTEKKEEEKKKEVEKKKTKKVINSSAKPTPAPTKKKNSGKHAGGRTNIRGESGKDYKMVNVAVPVDVYEKVKAASNGNMTYYINAVLKKSVENVV